MLNCAVNQASSDYSVTNNVLSFMLFPFWHTDYTIFYIINTFVLATRVPERLLFFFHFKILFSIIYSFLLKKIKKTLLLRMKRNVVNTECSQYMERIYII